MHYWLSLSLFPSVLGSFSTPSERVTCTHLKPSIIIIIIIPLIASSHHSPPHQAGQAAAAAACGMCCRSSARRARGTVPGGAHHFSLSSRFRKSISPCSCFMALFWFFTIFRQANSSFSVSSYFCL
uniref:Putative secreted protein n=1 Tax=Anopheles marajoara TaxID=58244 RepID=A0A2M4C7B1_9DIPT